MIDINETFIPEESVYFMPYSELFDIFSFVMDHDLDLIPDDIKSYLSSWNNFLLDNL